MKLARWLILAVVLCCAAACNGRRDQPREGALGGGPVLHLADHLQEATIRSAGAPAAARQGRGWSFGVPRPEWRTVSAADVPHLAAVGLEPVADGVRLALSRSPSTSLTLVGGIAIDLEGLRFDDWDTVLVRARSREPLAGLTVSYNLDEKGAVPSEIVFYSGGPTAPPVFSDGSVQTYAIPLQAREGAARPAALRSLGIFVGAAAPASLDILAVSLVPRGAAFVDRYGARPVTRAGLTRQTLFAHTPASLSWKVAAPSGARLDFALSVIPGEAVTYRVTARAGGEGKTLFAETVRDAVAWGQRSVDLSAWGGSIVELTLEAASERPGTVVLWGAPMVSGRDPRQRAQRPNVIFYVIDGGGADLMSVYGYNRRTTPFLERLAEEGVVFEHAYSSSTWTQPSTASFMTSLHHSVLGGLRRGVHSTPVPAAATTMAEHLRRAGYQTAVFTSNPNAGRVIGLERGVDWMRDEETEHLSTSSAELHEFFWDFRERSPAEPYWVHFQTTDVHEPHEPVQPFAGLFVSPEERARIRAWDEQIIEAALPLFGTTSIPELYDQVLARTGIDRQAYFGLLRGLYDETMAHQDHQLGRLVERLKREGEWNDTLLVITADHGHPAGTFTRFGRGLFDPQPEPWQGALFDSYNTRVPLIFVWPGRIAGGRRIDQPVSTIDILPTLLDFLGLPQPEVVQGQSLAPLLLGRPSQLRPVLLDEFRVDERGELVGNLEIIDGRWGASLEIGPHPQGPAATKGRHAVPAGGRWGAVHPYYPDAPRLLLYDLWNDPFALRAVNDRHPELVEHYRRMLLRQWRAHLALARRFREAGEVALTPEQLRQLRSLGYIR
jgi:arylsulfatase A-like enzyme